MDSKEDTFADLIDAHLQLSASSWSVGEFGVLAEFHHTQPERGAIDVRTVGAAGGALRIESDERMRDLGLRVLAYETPSPNPRLWNHGIAFCLPENVALMDNRSGVTELGPDREAIFESDRNATLFDLGLGRRSLNFCVRSADPALIDVLRGASGAAVFDCPDLLAVLAAAGPTRVVLSRIARVEVSNPIPPPGGVSPEGPHTHLLPGLMKARRTHNASIPVPAGFLPCLTLYPAHPARDAEGRERAFDPRLHAAYQSLLERHGDAEFVAGKREVVDMEEGAQPLAQNGEGAQPRAQNGEGAQPRAHSGGGYSRARNLGRLIAARQRAIAR